MGQANEIQVLEKLIKSKVTTLLRLQGELDQLRALLDKLKAPAT